MTVIKQGVLHPHLAVRAVLGVAGFAFIGIYYKISVRVPVTAAATAGRPRVDTVKVVLRSLRVRSDARDQSGGIVQACHGRAAVGRAFKAHAVYFFIRCPELIQLSLNHYAVYIIHTFIFLL